MQCKIFLFLAVTIFMQVSCVKGSGHQLSQGAEVNHILFNQNYLFYLSRIGSHFGFISRQSGEIMSKYELQSHESIIAIHKEQDTVILRSARQKAILFNIQSSHLEEVTVQIAFKHQQILDVAKHSGKVFVLTDKDVRVYDQGEQKKAQALKNIVSSARKNEYFKKLFLKSGQGIEDMLILLIKNGEVCIRSFQKVKRGTDECYFKTPYQITSIDQVDGNILIQTEIVNYVITKDLKSFYSFKGHVTQFNQEYILLSDFKTYDTQNQMFLDGLIVEGSTKEHLFWIHSTGESKTTVYFNSILVGDLRMGDRPRRAWVTFCEQAKTRYQLLVEFSSNRFDMYDIEIRDNELTKFELKWETQAVEKASPEEL